MKQKKSNLFLFSVKFGLILGLVFIVYSLLLYVIKVDIFNVWFSIVQFFITATIFSVGMSIAMKKFRDDYLENKIKYGQAFLVGLIVAVVSFIINGLYGFVFYSYFDPTYMEEGMLRVVERMEAMNIPEDILVQQIERIEQQIKPTRQLISALTAGPIFGGIISLIVAAVVKKDTTEQTV
jgi:ethanolamine transporter EutH